MATKEERPESKQVSYLMPADVIRQVRIEAAERGVWPATLVTEVLATHFAKKSKKQPKPSTN